MKELINLLTMAGLEVEEAVSVGEGFEKVVVAEIQSVRRQPNADRLSLVEVKTHGKISQSSAVRPILREGKKFL